MSKSIMAVIRAIRRYIDCNIFEIMVIKKTMGEVDSYMHYSAWNEPWD